MGLKIGDKIRITRFYGWGYLAIPKGTVDTVEAISPITGDIKLSGGG